MSEEENTSEPTEFKKRKSGAERRRRFNERYELLRQKDRTRQLNRKIELKKKLLKKRLKTDATRGLVYLGHIPHGFYEQEIKKYFGQFGKVTNIKVCRSRKTGNSKGYAFIEFEHSEVAKIAAETMHNYIMFKRRLIAEYIPPEKRPKRIFHNEQVGPGKTTFEEKYLRFKKSKEKDISDEQHLRKSKRVMNKLKHRMEKLKSLGIDYDLKPVDVPEQLVQNN